MKGIQSPHLYTPAALLHCKLSGEQVPRALKYARGGKKGLAGVLHGRRGPKARRFIHVCVP